VHVAVKATESCTRTNVEQPTSATHSFSQSGSASSVNGTLNESKASASELYEHMDWGISTSVRPGVHEGEVEVVLEVVVEVEVVEEVAVEEVAVE